VRRGSAIGAAAAVAALLALTAAPAQAAKSCAEPGAAWERAAPAAAGMDAAKLQAALDYGSENLGFAVRVYRYGCLVGEDRLAATNRDQRFQSWSMAKSVTSLFFGRAMTLRAISAEDPVGSLVTEADRPHGAITARQLLTQTSGLEWNGFRDYNISIPDRVRDALTLGIARPPGTYFEYAQSPVALLAEQVGRAVGEDVQNFGQRELMDRVGIPAGAWSWGRDRAGHVQGFFDVQMRPDDYARLGELMRRGGVWRGRRVLSRAYMQEAIAPSWTNGCYGWLNWVNSGAPCIGPRVSDRPVSDQRDFPDLPQDMYRFSGLFGQLVTVFPGQGLLIVRVGQDPGLLPAGGANWEHGLYERVLAAVSDKPVPHPGPERPNGGGNRENSDTGFQNALAQPDKYSKGAVQDPLPAAGPARARAVQLGLVRKRVGRRGVLVARLRCPARWPSKMKAGCRGRATLSGARKRRRYSIAPGKSKLLRFKLTGRRMRKLRHRGEMPFWLAARNADAAGGTLARVAVNVKRPATRH
jgi:CubicO group peptidase (beta-lactamase class C family)